MHNILKSIAHHLGNAEKVFGMFFFFKEWFIGVYESYGVSLVKNVILRLCPIKIVFRLFQFSDLSTNFLRAYSIYWQITYSYHSSSPNIERSFSDNFYTTARFLLACQCSIFNIHYFKFSLLFRKRQKVLRLGVF